MLNIQRLKFGYFDTIEHAGSDEGKVLGSLMTGGKQSSGGGTVDPLISKNKRRRRKKRRNRGNLDKPVVSKRQEVKVDTPDICDSVTANKLVNYSSDSTSDEDSSTKYPKLKLPSFIKGSLICKIIDPSKMRLCSSVRNVLLSLCLEVQFLLCHLNRFGFCYFLCYQF